MTEDRLKILQGLSPCRASSDEIIFTKKIILDDLCKDNDILEVLDNKDLLDNNSPPEDYIENSIYPYMHIPNTQSRVKNFICFDINVLKTVKDSKVLLDQTLLIRTIAHENTIKTKYGIARQDLLAFLIKQRFAWSNVIGNHLKLVYDSGKVSESGYYYREMQFENLVLNNLIRGGITNVFDKQRDIYSSFRD